MLAPPHGTLIGGVVGVVLGAIAAGAGVVLQDELGCVWWWISTSFMDWLTENLWWLGPLYILFPLLAEAEIMTAFLLNGYLRVGSGTFYDAVGAGNPKAPSGGGGGACVAEGTLVTMADGSVKAVEDIEVGDQVLGFDPITGSYVAENVLDVTSTKVELIENINNGALRLTPTDQPVYIRNSTYEGWLRDPEKIEVGWEIFDAETSTWVAVTSITYEEGKTSVRLYHRRLSDIPCQLLPPNGQGSWKEKINEPTTNHIQNSPFFSNTILNETISKTDVSSKKALVC